MKEITGILDENYTTTRSSHAYGGYVLFFPNAMDFNNLAPKIMEEYNINPDLYEFEYKFTESQDSNWTERQYLLSSDDALVFIYRT